MNWSDLTANWSAAMSSLRARFPYLEADDLEVAPQTQDELMTFVAERHNLTRREAEEEVRDWALITSLARGAGDLRSG